MPLGYAPQVPIGRRQSRMIIMITFIYIYSIYNDCISRSQGSALGMIISAGHAWRPTIAPSASGTLRLRVDQVSNIHDEITVKQGSALLLFRIGHSPPVK